MSLKIYVKGNYFYIIDTSDNNKIYEAFAKDAKIRRLNEASTDFYVTNVNGFREDRKVPYSEILNEAGGTYTDIDAFITFYEDNTGKSSGGASPIPTETSEAINSLESDVEALETQVNLLATTNPEDAFYVRRDEILDEGANLYDKNDVENDNAGWLNSNNVPQAHVSATHTKYFKLIPNQEYWYLNAYGASTNLIIVDESFVKVRSFAGTVDNKFTVAASGEAYVRFSVRDMDDFMFAKGSTIGTYEAYLFKIKTKLIDQALYANTKVVAFGDSITYLPSSWVTTFKELVGVQYIDNYAISGQKIAWKAGTVETSNPPNNGHDNNVLWNSIKKWELTTPESPDAIIIALGTNDISQGSILGDFTNAFAQDEPITTQLTMANAYRKAIHYLLTNYPNTQIFYCNPLQSKTGGRNYNTISNVGNILIDVSKRYGVKVIDVTNECGITQEFENEGVAGRYLYDGTHPTSPVSAAGSEVGVEFGSVMQGNYIASQFKKQFIV